MADLLTIYNRALSAARVRRLLSEPNQQGIEGDQLRLWYPQISDLVMRSAHWPSCKAHARLALLRERPNGSDWSENEPDPGWRYAYAAPNDMLAPRYLHSYARFERSYFGPQQVRSIVTDQEDAILTYTRRQTNTELWDIDLVNAVVLALAAAIVRPITGKLGDYDRLNQEAIDAVVLAQTSVANDGEQLAEELPEWLAVRGFAPPPIMDTFVYPYERFNGVPA